MGQKLGTAAILAAVMIGPAGIAQAHHSFAMFDLTHTVTLTGTVKEWEWTNPHSWLELTVAKPGGSLTQYSFESRSIYLLMRAHVHRTTLQPGQIVTVVYNPLRDGENGGSLVSATGQDGTPLISRPPRPGAGRPPGGPPPAAP